ncbi:cytochrome c peroxidase [Lacimicrobium sp. SS2-24]|uniref:cytochrome-c peroxidase n=1 Tax=Lacimicrobium sp. SS2-24 TaxID=2005569 RepID=UPI001FEDB280|nr:cytochrome c peroxidase [Lacimicrobium sp. SS2-24]
MSRFFIRFKGILVPLLCMWVVACGSEPEAEVPVSETVGQSQSDVTSDNEASDPLASLNLPETPYNYAQVALPEHYTQNSFPAQMPFQYAASDSDNTPVDNPITDAAATLGRVLFYDKKLSANGTVACASCHVQENGFSDARVKSLGFEGEETRRHSMGLTNARFYGSGRFFWDERATSLEEQVLMPFQDPLEMGLVLPELEEIIREQDYYPILFEQAFGDTDVSSDRIADALAQFIRAMVSTNAKYDMARAEVSSPLADFPAFTDQENLGKALFFEAKQAANGDLVGCAGCHSSEAFTGPLPVGPLGNSSATNNGLDSESTDDLGLAEVTGNPLDTGRFKSPSLRNIAVTAPYMHDGRFSTLEEVIEHYSSGIQAHPGLQPPLLGSDGSVNQFNFTDDEKAALLAFLHTLTDEALLIDERFSDPFL